MIISDNKTTIYEIVIEGKDKNEIEEVYSKYLKTDTTRKRVTHYDNCECCGMARIIIEYDNKKTLFNAYKKLPLENIPDTVIVNYNIDTETINKLLHEMVKDHFNKNPE